MSNVNLNLNMTVDQPPLQPIIKLTTAVGTIGLTIFGVGLVIHDHFTSTNRDNSSFYDCLKKLGITILAAPLLGAGLGMGVAFAIGLPLMILVDSIRYIVESAMSLKNQLT